MPASISSNGKIKGKMGRRAQSRKPPVARALFVLLFISVIVYLVTRSVFIAFAEYSGLEKILAVIFFMSEAFIMFHAFGYFGTVYRLSLTGEDDESSPVPENSFPSVAILIPARHEPRDVLDKTLLSCYNLVYPNKQIYLLDDSSQESFSREAEEVARRYDVKIFRRQERHGAKAGIINDCLKTLGEKYVVIFDADQNPMPNFLEKLIPLLEEDPKLALVQTPQFYSNLGQNKISYAANMQQAVFYEYICEAKSSSQAMICCGTNVVVRRDALNDVGGFDESTVTEDFATSFNLHSRGWKTMYYNHVYTFGMGPEDLAAYFKQQNRWAMGNVKVFRKILTQILTAPMSLRFVQWWEYILTGSYYLVGWAYLFLFLCPVAYLFFNVPSFFMNPVVYTFSFFPYLILSTAVFYTSMIAREFRISQLMHGQLLSMITLPVYMRASLWGLLGVKGSFQVTTKGGQHRVSYISLWPQLFFWGLNLAAISWGINRYIYEQTAAVLLNVAWASYHFILLSSIFYYNE